ncbi:hypothetical protein GA0070611_4929 [Micromonospora auratinigra]|uniref:Uncharacterized protein n=1 Tax=Micromonospora auratinigra TaxID=261654 RepID=A0A1A9A348_9ACTN|nr:hypothetical protein GA0070611_4929 [Micromonospora auratinigra]
MRHLRGHAAGRCRRGGEGHGGRLGNHAAGRRRRGGERHGGRLGNHAARRRRRRGERHGGRLGGGGRAVDGGSDARATGPLTGTRRRSVPVGRPGTGAGGVLHPLQARTGAHGPARQADVAPGELRHEPGRQVTLDRQARIDRQPPLVVGPAGRQFGVRDAPGGTGVLPETGTQRGGGGECQDVRPTAGRPGPPARPGGTLAGDRQQQLHPGQQPEVELLVLGAQRVPHRHLGLGGRFPSGHGHHSFRAQATGIAYNLQGGNKITMAGRQWSAGSRPRR